MASDATSASSHSRSSLAWRVGFGTTLATAMGTGTFLQGGLAALAVFIIADLDLTRTQFGVMVFALSAMGAIGAVWAGRVADRLGGREMLLLTFALTGAGMMLLAWTSTYPLAVVGAAMGGLGIAGGNPATNKLIGRHLGPGERGLIMGVKQAGATGGVFLAGLSLPALATMLDWRPAISVSIALPLLGMVMVWLVVPNDGRVVTKRPSAHTRVPAAAWWVATNGMLVGGGQGALLAYIPLYSFESLGVPQARAGSLVAVLGGVGVASRILWGKLGETAYQRSRLRTERSVAPPYSGTLLLLTVLSTAAAMSVLVAQGVGVWLVWGGAIFAGATALAWQSVGMLAVIEATDQKQMGVASGLVQFGFLAGFSLTPVAFGLIVDQTQTYALGWGMVVALFGLATGQILVWRFSHGRQ